MNLFLKHIMWHEDKFIVTKFIKILLTIVLLKTHNKTLFKNSKQKKSTKVFSQKIFFSILKFKRLNIFY